MKQALKFIALCLVALLIAACSTSRKLEKNTDKVVADSVSESISKVADACKVVDTTKTESGESIITEIIFFGDSARAPDLPELIIDKDGKMTIKGGGREKHQANRHPVKRGEEWKDNGKGTQHHDQGQSDRPQGEETQRSCKDKQTFKCMDVGNRRINRCRSCLVHAVQKANIGMVAQVACIHAQGFGINFVPLQPHCCESPLHRTGNNVEARFIAGLL